LTHAVVVAVVVDDDAVVVFVPVAVVFVELRILCNAVLSERRVMQVSSPYVRSVCVSWLNMAAHNNFICILRLALRPH